MLVKFDPNTWYKLTNTFLGPEIALDVVNSTTTGELKMARWITSSGSQGHSGQHWRIWPHPANDGTYKLSTWYTGPGQCLAVTGKQPHLAVSNWYAAQKWRIVPWFGDDCREIDGKGSSRRRVWDGTYRLSSEYEGQDIMLDTYAGCRTPYMGSQDTTGKHWNITPVKQVTGEQVMVVGST